MLIIEKTLDFLTPYDCLGCGQEGSLLCDWCTEEKIIPLPSRCYKCNQLTRDFAVCEKCRPKARMSNVWVVSEYSGVVQKLIKRLKFERSSTAAGIIARFMVEILPYLTDDILVVHVPTATSRRRLRGYDQAELIAKGIAKRLELRHQTLLARIGQSRQVGAKRQKRQSQLKNAFRVVRPQIVNQSKILLIDDVVTTGATLETVAKVLKDAGAKKVYAAIFAQR